MSEAMKTENLEKLGMYKLKTMLGSNGVFASFQGFHTDSTLPAAIVTVHESSIANPAAWEAFVAEIGPIMNQGASRLCQPHGYGHECEHYWAAYEWMKGNHLGIIVRDNGLPAAADAFQWMSEVAEALATLHRRGAQHRILSPASIFINELGQAKLLHTAWHHMILATEGGLLRPEMLSILPFAAPEVVAGKASDEAADVYSIGSNLYYLLTGQPAHWDEDPATLAHLIRTQPVDLGPLHGVIPNMGIAVLDEMLSLDPGDRPINLPALSDRLTAVIAVLQGAAEDVAAVVSPMSATRETALPSYAGQARTPELEPEYDPHAGHMGHEEESSSRLSEVIRERQKQLDEASEIDKPSAVTVYKETVITKEKRQLQMSVLVGLIVVVVGIVGVTVAVSMLGLFSGESATPAAAPTQAAAPTAPIQPAVSDAVYRQYRQTHEQLRVLGQLSKGFHRTNGVWPKKVEDLEPLGATPAEFLDAWDTKIDIRGHYVMSAGADKKWDNEDDLWWDADLGTPGGYNPSR